MQTADQKKRETLLDNEWVEDIVFVFSHIHSCEELAGCWDTKWQQCPNCGAEVKQDGTITHRMQ